MRYLPLAFVLCLLAGGCKSKDVRDDAVLPFHVAVVPVQVDQIDLVVREEGAEDEASKVVLVFDSDTFSRALATSLDGNCFARATLMPPPPEGEEADAHFLRVAQQGGADLILAAQLRYDDDVDTELNDRFWLNLPLFLLGGPATWFVNDRSYHFDVRLETHVYDVRAAMRSGGLDASSRIVRMNHESKEASLDFLDRSSGAGSYGLSFIVPSGLVAKESDKVSPELVEYVAQSLGEGLAAAMHDRALEINQSDLVDFYPAGVTVVSEGEQRYLEGEMVLGLGDVTELGGWRYRTSGGQFIEASFGEASIDRPGGRDPIRRYGFRIPLEGLDGGTVQIEVRQEDRDASSRTFTYTIPSALEE